MAYITSKKHGDKHRQRTSVVASALMLALPVAALAAEQAEATLPTVKVEADGDAPAYKADSVSSPKFVQPLVNTTQTITVIKSELMHEQGATTLTEALRNSPGVSTFMLGENGSTNTGDSVYMRGFDASSAIFVDGVRDLGAISRDMFNIEQVEVVKGPSGSDNGRGAPTGYINLVSKTAKLDESLAGAVSVGSGDRRRVSADWDTRIAGIDGAAFRLNMVDQKSGVAGRDEIKNDHWGIAPSVAFGLGSDTRAYISYLHVKQDNVPEGGVYTIGLPGFSSPDGRAYIANAPKVDPSNFYGSSSDYDKATADMFTTRFEHDFGKGVTLHNTTRYGKTSEQYLITGYTGTAANLITDVKGTSIVANDPSTWLLKRANRQVKDQTNEILTNQTNITADLKTGGIKHQLSAGIELSHEKATTYGYSGTGSAPDVNLYHPNPDAPVTGLNLVRNGVTGAGSTNTLAAYVFDTMTLSEQWLVNAGLRVDHYSTDLNAVALSGTTLVPTTASTEGNLRSWKLGAVYKPAANGSIYVDFASSLQPPGGASLTLSTAANNASNPIYSPEKAQTYELGTKWELLNKRLSVDAALYRTDISNDVEVDPTDATKYYQTGKKRVQGVEVTVSGNITKQWAVNAGYTLMDTKVVSGKPQGADATSSGLNYTPRNAFTSWTTYQPIDGLTVGGGARYVGKLQRGSDGAIGTPQYADAYWVMDAMAAYDVNKHLNVQLNVYNLTDKQYVAAINKSGYRYQPGVPRSAQLTANFLF